eukprot:TRINITY_DN71308_c0_g1_i1.p1 TRINITY_DN71308_c0_g1~~TRINITY_DN71308_c0_g1_i1.p1  ORF type:complete len:466 (-),score=121.26 TRINITY_DN71308_c0_g1_i1:271-1668(-)
MKFVTLSALTHFLFAAPRAQAVVLASSSKNNAREETTCSCDCCETSIRQQAALDGSVNMFEVPVCSYVQPGLLSWATAPSCSSQCFKSNSDHVLESTQQQEIDTERFCYVECMPEPKLAGEIPQAGDLCRAQSKEEVDAAKDSTGNGHDKKNEVEAPVEQLVDQASADSILGLSLRKTNATDGELVKPWDGVITESGKAEALAKEAQEKAEKADAESVRLESMAMKGSITLPLALGAVEDARLAARFALMTRDKIHEILLNAQSTANFEAMAMIGGVVNPIKAAARVAAQGAALARGAAKTKANALASHQKGFDAMAGWEKAMAAAANIRDQYANGGDSLASLAAGSEQQAQALLVEADQWKLHDEELTKECFAQCATQLCRDNCVSVKGDKYQRDKLLGESKGAFDTATSLDRASKAAMAKAREIDASLPAYARQAQQASFYAAAQPYPAEPASMPYVGEQYGE